MEIHGRILIAKRVMKRLVTVHAYSAYLKSGRLYHDNLCSAIPPFIQKIFPIDFYAKTALLKIWRSSSPAARPDSHNVHWPHFGHFLLCIHEVGQWFRHKKYITKNKNMFFGFPKLVQIALKIAS